MKHAVLAGRLAYLRRSHPAQDVRDRQQPGRRPRRPLTPHAHGRRAVSEDARAALIERLNTSWRIVGPPPPVPSITHTLLQPIRRALARLLRPQETFNSQVVQYVNASLSTIERYRWAL